MKYNSLQYFLIYLCIASFLETSSVQEKRPKQKRTKKKIVDSNTPDVNVKITPDEEVADIALKSALVENKAPEELITLREAASTIQRPLEVCFLTFFCV